MTENKKATTQVLNMFTENELLTYDVKYMNEYFILI